MPLLLKTIFSGLGVHTLRAFEKQCRDPMAAQRTLLQRYLARNAETAYGKRYGFASIRTWEEFGRQVPIVGYEDLEPYVDRLLHGVPGQLTAETPVLFAMTSGTTGRSKFIPVTLESRAAKSHQMRIWLSCLFRDYPAILDHQLLTVVSPEVESVAPCGTPCGAESGHGYRSMPPAVRKIYSTPYDVFEIRDYEAKYYTLLRIGCGHSVGMLYMLNPSTVLLIAQEMGRWTESIIRDVRDGTLRWDAEVNERIRGVIEAGLTPDPERARQLEKAAERGGGRLRPREVWPDLQAICCWKGGTVGMYLDKFVSYFRSDTPVRDVGYYATEVRGSVVLTDEGSSGVLGIGTNVYEFWPADEDRRPDPSALLTADRLEEGRRYFIFVTTHAGLYRYDMNDIIEVTGRWRDTPLIRFIQKGKGVVSFTGEKLYEAQVLAAVEEAWNACRGRYEFIAAVGRMVGDRPRYEFLAEFDEGLTDGEARCALARLDEALGRSNVEYAAKRQSLRIADPVLRLVRAGSFAAYRRRAVRQGRSDGQFKTLRLTADPAYVEEFDIERSVLLRDPAP